MGIGRNRGYGMIGWLMGKARGTGWFIKVAFGLGMLLAPALQAQSPSAIPITNGPIVTPYNTPAINAPVRVCLASSVGTPCSTTGVTLYSDANLTQKISNPASTNSNGIYGFYINASQYTLPQFFYIQITISSTVTYYYQFLATVASGIPSIPVPVAQGGSGMTSLTPYAPLFGGTSSTSPMQSLSSLGTSGQALISGGSSALPAYGTLGIGGGGTGATTQAGAFTNIVGPGGIITGPFSLTTPLGIASGGSGQTTANAAMTAFGITQTGSGSSQVDTFPGTAGAGSTIQIGVNSYTGIQLAISTCGSALHCDFWINGQIAPTSNLTIPANVEIHCAGGTISPSTGVTVTFAGSNQISDPTGSQCFGGAGAVTGLTLTRPEWFGSTTINAALLATLGPNGGVVDLQDATYQSAFTSFTTPGSTCIDSNDIWIHGAKQPVVDNTTTPTKLQNGTVIQGGLTFCGAMRPKVTDLGGDVGSAFEPNGSTSDGIDVNGTTGGTTPSDPMVDSPYVQNVTTLLTSTAAYHGILVEHTNNARVENVDTWLGTHGFVLKSTNAQAAHIRAHGESSEGLDIKSDAYTTAQNITITDFQAYSVSSSFVLNNGLSIDADNTPVSGITLADINVQNARAGLTLTMEGAIGSGAISQVSLSNMQYAIVDSTVGITTSACINTTGSGGTAYTVQWANFRGISCSAGSFATMTPAQIYVPMNDSVISGLRAENGTRSTIEGTYLNLDNWQTTNTANATTFYVTNNSTVNINGGSFVEPSLALVDSGSQANIFLSGVIRNTSTYPLDVQNAAGTSNSLLVDQNGNVTVLNYLISPWAIGAGSNPLTISGGSGATSDLVVENVAHNAVLLDVTDSGGVGWGPSGTAHIVSDSGTILRTCGTITTTASASDALSCAWVATSSTCTFTATNGAASGLTGLYMIPTSGTATLYHSATSGGTFQVACSTE